MLFLSSPCGLSALVLQGAGSSITQMVTMSVCLPRWQIRGFWCLSFILTVHPCCWRMSPTVVTLFVAWYLALELLPTVWSRCCPQAVTTLLVVSRFELCRCFSKTYSTLASCKLLSWQFSFRQFTYYNCITLLDILCSLTQLRGLCIPVHLAYANHM